MKGEKIYSIFFLLLLASLISSACSSTRINAQPSAESAQVNRQAPAESSTPGFKKPKRISKDIILDDAKDKKEAKSKAKSK